MTKSYEAITKYYHEAYAERSGLPYINHIDEGLIILDRINASDTAKEAYCIHPLLQTDVELSITLKHDWLEGIHPNVIATSMEYRAVANAYLSLHCVTVDDPIALSWVGDVNDCLIADKVQNYKDFLIHHAETHPNRHTLDRYFKNWLNVLDVQDKFAELIEGL